VQQPLRFESPCGNRENFNLVQGGERSCVRGSGVACGSEKENTYWLELVKSHSFALLFST
jgi:hypothetical protein